MDANLAWDDLRLLPVIAEHGSFLAAGRMLGLATSTLSRRLDQLERGAGRKLVERRHDGVRLTEAGRTLAELAAQMDSSLQAGLRSLPGGGESLRGTIRVSTGDGFADVVVAVMARFREQHPQVGFELVIEARLSDLTHGQADLAVRTVRGEEQALVYERVAALRYGIFASASYIAGHGAPRSRAALAHHQVVGFAAPLDRVGPMRALRAMGAKRVVLRASNFGGYLAAVRAGLGLGALPELSSAGLDRVLPRADLPEIEIYVCTHRDARALPHVKAFRTELVRELRLLGA